MANKRLGMSNETEPQVIISMDEWKRLTDKQNWQDYMADTFRQSKTVDEFITKINRKFYLHNLNLTIEVTVSAKEIVSAEQNINHQ